MSARLLEDEAFRLLEDGGGRLLEGVATGPGNFARFQVDDWPEVVAFAEFEYEDH